MNSPRPFAVSIALLLSAAIAIADPANFLPRDWTQRDGSTTFGRFERIQGDDLLLKKDGREISISREKLSAADWEKAVIIGKTETEGLVGESKKMAFAYVSLEKPPYFTFEMGAPKEAFARQGDEPQHLVKLSHGFFLKRTEVTWAEWSVVRELAQGHGYPHLSVGRNGYHGDASGTHPVTEVSWLDAVLWCNLKSEVENLKAVYYRTKDFSPDSILRDKNDPREVYMDRDAAGYRLPTEAEWELAWYTGAMTDPQKFGGWSALNASGNTHPVGTAQGTKDLQFHDMLGNVSEWCWDWKAPISKENDPVGPENGKYRIFRGGSWADPPWCCYPSYRGDYTPNIPSGFFTGFRPARNPSK